MADKRACYGTTGGGNVWGRSKSGGRRGVDAATTGWEIPGCNHVGPPDVGCGHGGSEAAPDVGCGHGYDVAYVHGGGEVGAP